MALFLFLAACCFPKQTVLDSPPSLGHALRATVALIDEDPLSSTWNVYCSGFFVSPTRIVTAAHCVDDDSGLDPVGKYIYFAKLGELKPDGEMLDSANPHQAVVIAFNKTVDVAVIAARSPDRSRNFLLPARSVRQGEPVTLIGHPLGQSWTVSHGVVSRLVRIRGIRFVQTDATAWFGSSGGPCLNAEGRLLGVASFLVGHVPQFNYYVHFGAIKKVLNTLPPADLADFRP